MDSDDDLTEAVGGLRIPIRPAPAGYEEATHDILVKALHGGIPFRWYPEPTVDAAVTVGDVLAYLGQRLLNWGASESVELPEKAEQAVMTLAGGKTGEVRSLTMRLRGLTLTYGETITVSLEFAPSGGAPTVHDGGPLGEAVGELLNTGNLGITFTYTRR